MHFRDVSTSICVEVDSEFPHEHLFVIWYLSECLPAIHISTVTEIRFLVLAMDDGAWAVVLFCGYLHILGQKNMCEAGLYKVKHKGGFVR